MIIFKQAESNKVFLPIVFRTVIQNDVGCPKSGNSNRAFKEMENVCI